MPKIKRPSQVFKVQRSLVTNNPATQVLVYNQDRSVSGQFDADDSILKMMGTRVKMFVRAQIIGQQIDILKEISGEDW